MPETEGNPNQLKDKLGVVVGHGSGIHPEMKHGFLCIYLVRVDDQWVLCRREGSGLYDWAKARQGLGKSIAGELFAPHAYKGIALTVPFWRLKKLMDESFKEDPKVTFEWVDEDDAPWEELFGSGPLEDKVAAREARWAKEEAMVPGTLVRTLRGWSSATANVPVEGTCGGVVKDKRTPAGMVCVEFKPPLVVHGTNEELSEDYGAYRLFYDFDDLEVAGPNMTLSDGGEQ